MTEKVTLCRQDNLPMPLILLESPESLADWYVSQLSWALGQGQRELTISCFDTAPMGYETGRAAYTVLKAVTDFLYDHPQVERLAVLCGDDAAFSAYSFHWNMWYAAHKPSHDSGPQGAL